MSRPSLRRLGLLALLTVLLSSLSSLLVTTAALAAGKPVPKPPSVTFGLGPSTTKKIDGRPYFNYLSSPLARFTDHVAIVNVSAKPLTLSVYATDASNALDGSFTYPLSSAAPVDAGGWIKVETPKGSRTVIVPGRGTLILPMQVAVPKNASPGDHAAAVIVSLTALSKNGTGQRINLDQRVAARVFFRVSGPAHPRLAVERLRVSYAPDGLLSGTATVRYRIHNTGNVKLAASQRVRVNGVFASKVRAGAAVPLLLPGGSFDVTSVVSHLLPQVRMTAKVTVTPLGIQGDAVIHADDAVASTHFWAVPWLLLLIVGAVLLFVAGVLWQRRRRRKRKPPSEMAGDPAGLPAPPTPTGAGSSPAGWAKRLALLIAVSCSCLTLPGTATAADAVPYVDQAVTGSIALCDVNGHNVLSGKLSDTPFVWRAVGTTAAPSPYDQPGRTAFLAAYQPRRGVDPGNWSGYGLAAASRYTNPAHPMSQAAANSSPLTDFTERYTPEWDGLVQLRLMLGGSGRVPLSTAYDATDIKVTGDSWQVVRGGTGPCGKSAGSATNAAVLLKLPGSLGTPKPGAIASPPPLKQSPVPQTSHASAGTTTDQGGGSSPTDGATPSSGIAQADRTKADGGSITPIVVVGVLGLGLGALLTIWARRRRTAA